MTNRIVIVGGGPAGISAAGKLSEYGIKTTVLEEHPRIGGVIYRGPWRDTAELPHLDDKLQASMAKLKNRYEKNKHNIELKTNVRVLGPNADQSLLVNDNDKISSVDYEQLILATGCQERSIPFSGWQLPGVMLMGGIQLQLKSGLVRTGDKVALVGTGPLLVLIACQLHQAGSEVVGIFEATPFNKIAKETLALLNDPQKTLDGLSMMLYIKKHKIPFHYGWGIVEAKGDKELEEVEVAPYDKNWVADKSQSKTIPADSMGVGYGFTARSQLAQLMQLDVEYNHQSGVIPVVNEWQQSNKSNIFCSGDSVKVAGADAAILEGEIAAVGVAFNLKKISQQEAESTIDVLRKKLNKVYKFRGAFDRANERKFGLLDLVQDDTVICRCEQVKKKDIDLAIEQGCKDIITLKMRTRVTMGDCQGKTCSNYCYDRLAVEGSDDKQTIVRPRFPLDPILFSALED